MKSPKSKLGFSAFILLFTLAAAVAPSAASAQQAHKKYVIAFVPKLINIGYFNAMLAGGNEAAKALDVTFDYEGPTTADASLQVQTIKQLIAKHVDAMAVAMGKEGDWAIDSCGPAAQNLNGWIAIEKARAAEQYPKMHLVTIVYSGEDIAKAVADSKDLITGHPGLKGIIGQCSTSGPGAAKAVTDLNMIGKVFVTGISVPSLMKPYVDNGSVKSFVLWNPVNLGFLTVWAGLQLVEGKPFQAVNNVPTIGQVRYDDSKKMLILGPPTVFDKSNIDKFNF